MQAGPIDEAGDLLQAVTVSHVARGLNKIVGSSATLVTGRTKATLWCYYPFQESRIWLLNVRANFADQVITTVQRIKTFTSAQTPRGKPAVFRSVETELDKL